MHLQAGKLLGRKGSDAPLHCCPESRLCTWAVLRRACLAPSPCPNQVLAPQASISSASIFASCLLSAAQGVQQPLFHLWGLQGDPVLGKFRGQEEELSM